MKVLITGSKGFIGKNLVTFLKVKNDFQILEFNKNDTINSLERKLLESDLLVHLAGINRTNNEQLFQDVNVNLTESICKILIKNSVKIPVFFTSSTQVSKTNEYGKSKLEGEKILKKLNNLNNNPVYIYRLPGIFGKWCKPNYNSVVATFCYNILNNIKITVFDKKEEIKLIYIDDFIKDLSLQFSNIINGFHFCDVNPQYSISVNELAENIKKFKESRTNFKLYKIGNGFLKKLFATYCSYETKKNSSYLLNKNTDHRGDFLEILKTEDAGQFAYFTAHPGITRGGHFHHTKCEKFLVVKGTAKFRFRNIISDEYFEKISTSDKPEIVDSIPGWAHDVTNVGSNDLIVFLWSNEIFDKNNPDTFQFDL